MAYAAEDPLGVTSELISLLLIITSFLVIAYLGSKTRNRRSFQFEMLLFTVVLVAAEVPRTLYSLGVVDLDSLSAAGLGVHSFSMIILTGFVAVRIRGFFRTSQVLGKEFEEVVQGAIDKGITKAVGHNAMKAMDFYVHSDIAVANADNYVRSLEKLFGTGSRVLIDTIVRSVCEATKIKGGAGLTLAAAIETGRQKFMSAGSPIGA